MQRVSIFIPESQVRQLKAVAKDRPYAELVREAIAQYLKTNAVKPAYITNEVNQA